MSTKRRLVGYVISAVGVILILAVGALGFEVYDLQHALRDVQSHIHTLSEESQHSIGIVAGLEKKQRQQQQATLVAQKQLQAIQVRLTELTHSRDWILSETYALIALADDKLRAHEVTTAIEQIKAARKHLHTLGDPRLDPVRMELEKAEVRLGTRPQIDTKALWRALAQLDGPVQQCAFKRLDQKRVEKPESLASEGSWQVGLKRTWVEFKSLVQVTREAENKVPLALTDQNRAEIRRLLQQLLEQAQWAVLRQDQEVYAASLQALSGWLQTYFSMSPPCGALYRQIQQLAQQPVVIPQESISEILDMLQKILSASPEVPE